MVAKQVALLSSVAYAYDNGVAKTPPMGWNSWNHFHCLVSAEVLKDTADQIVALGLDKVGYKYINTDDCWHLHDRRPDGRVQPADNFPGGDEGMRNLSSYIHSKGLKFGIYGAAGQITCAGRAGGLYHERIDAQTFADWEVDYLKYDDCGEVNIHSYAKFQAMRDALNSTGRPMVYSYEPHLTEAIGWAPFIGNTWRTGHDIGSSYESMFSDLTINNAWANVGGPGSWNDADMLEVGNTGLSESEARSHFALWCLIKSPLLIGSDLTSIKPEYLEILKNEELVAISQDALGHQGRLVASSVGPSGFRLPELTAEAKARLPAAITDLDWEAHKLSLASEFGGVTACQLADAETLGAEQVWSLEKGTIKQAGECITRKDDIVELVPCDGSAAQQWSGLSDTQQTTAQIFVEIPEPSPVPEQTFFYNSHVGVPTGDVRRCGTCCGANDTTSAMCANTTSDGRLYISETEMRERCAADSDCIGFALNAQEGNYYRPVTQATLLNSADSKWTTTFKTYWQQELGSLEDSKQNHRCGTCCGASDTTSDMCRGTSADGQLKLVDDEIRTRCEADTACAGYGHDIIADTMVPVTGVLRVNYDNPQFQSWRKVTTAPAPAPSKRMCLATDGARLMLEPCLDEPDQCSKTRCATSVRVRQLWYATKAGQLISSYTQDFIPPLHATSQGQLINVPKCAASKANANPPRPPTPPAAVDSTATLQVWAGKLSGNRVAVVLSNADSVAATVTAHWSDIWLAPGAKVSVRDALNHKDFGTATDKLSTQVASHDVAVFVLTPETDIVSV